MSANKEKAKQELREALAHLKSAWRECNDAFGSAYIEDINQYIMGSKEDGTQYPFHQSFDDMQIIDWIEGILEKLPPVDAGKRKSVSAGDNDYEYAAFAWSKKEQKYEQIGRAVGSELLCRNRYMEQAKTEFFQQIYDESKVVFKKRKISVVCGEWEVY